MREAELAQAIKTEATKKLAAHNPTNRLRFTGFKNVQLQPAPD